MLLKFLSNSPFLFVGGMALIFSKFFSMMAEEPENVKHTSGVVTRLWEPSNSSSYRAEVEFSLENGQKAKAKMLGLINIDDANVGDQIEIDYFINKNGDYFASSKDPRYMTCENHEADIKASRVCIGIAVFFALCYVVLTILEFVR